MIDLLGWLDEVERFVSAPKRGGTWLYCRKCPFRSRRWRTYRTHWRREHR